MRPCQNYEISFSIHEQTLIFTAKTSHFSFKEILRMEKNLSKESSLFQAIVQRPDLTKNKIHPFLQLL